MDSSILTPSEMDALLQPTSHGAASKVVKPIDLVVRDHQAYAVLPVLQLAADSLAARIAQLCSQFLRLPCKGASEPVEVVPGSHVTNLLAAARFVYGLRVDGRPASGAVAIDDLLGGMYVACQFGGEIDGVDVSDGPPSATERRTVSRLAVRILGHLRGVLERTGPPSISIETAESPGASKKPAAGQAVVLFTMRMTMLDRQSTVVIALETSAAGFKLPPETTGRDIAGSPLAASILNVPLTATVVLGTTLMPMRRFLSLAVDDLITLDSSVEGEIQLQIEERPRFLGKPIVSKGSLSLQINSRIKE